MQPMTNKLKLFSQVSDCPSALRAVPMALFPTMGSLQEVVDFAESKLPITNKNDINTLLMTFQNTLLKELTKS